MSIEIGVTKLEDGKYFIAGLGIITPPTGITFKQRNGYCYWLARRRESVAIGKSELKFEQLFRVYDVSRAWLAYKNAVEALYENVRYIYTGRHFMRFEPINKLVPTGKVGVNSFSPAKGVHVVRATMGGDLLFSEYVRTDSQHRDALNRAIAKREFAESGWLKEHRITLAKALEVVDERRSAITGKRTKRSKAAASHVSH